MTDTPTNPSSNKNVSIGGDVSGVVIVGDNNVVNKQTIIQKFFNIFKSDAETLEQRNRRILLNHVENAWIKGVLDASLHGAALLDLGIKQDPNAVTQYPWALKKESTDETLPAGTSMLEIFDSIGMGRSLLILGAPGSGKTTMLLELARGLIARAREDVTQPIPMVFNLSSWTESKTLADWLAQELNNLYSVPRKTAPDWVKGNKLLLLLDGLDEVRQESRTKCLEAINEFRKQNGLTSLAVCSRSQDYADLQAKLSFEGAIEVQPLTQDQIAEFFNRFGDEMAGIKQTLEKDGSLREMAETPLFLSIMLMAYRDRRDVEILVSGDEKARRKHLFDTYIERMFERPRTKNVNFKKQDILHWLSWLASKMIEHNQVPYLLENMQPNWIFYENQLIYRRIVGLIGGLINGLIGGLIGGLIVGSISGSTIGQIVGLIFGLIVGLNIGQRFGSNDNMIFMVDSFSFDWLHVLIFGLVLAIFSGIAVIAVGFIGWLAGAILPSRLPGSMLISVLSLVLLVALGAEIRVKQVDLPTYPGQRLVFTQRISIFYILLCLIFGSVLGVYFGGTSGLLVGMVLGLFPIGVEHSIPVLIRHYALRLILARNNLLPRRLVPFLDHCVDLIFLRRVGGGYIFIHRLLMEHFAEMYVETPQ